MLKTSKQHLVLMVTTTLMEDVMAVTATNKMVTVMMMVISILKLKSLTIVNSELVFK